jgi:hypothetical protein
MLKKILSLVLNCEKEKVSKHSKETAGATGKCRESKPSTKMDIRHSTEKIPDPWFN